MRRFTVKGLKYLPNLLPAGSIRFFDAGENFLRGRDRTAWSTIKINLRLAADSATFTVGFSGIGLVPDSGVSLFLPLLIGMGRATWFTFNNIPITAAEALEWGMVTRIIPEAGLIPESISLAEQLVAGPVGVFGMAKRAFNEAVLSNLEQTLEFEAQMQVDASRGAEHREGLTAFLEKRRPMFD